MAFAFGTADSAFSARLVTLPSVHKSTALASKLEHRFGTFTEQFKLRTGMLIEMPAEIWTRSDKASTRKPTKPRFSSLDEKESTLESQMSQLALYYSHLSPGQQTLTARGTV